jgi:uncharacterized membrane protein YeaQ/YmgE (transglycosylase-associated protein family)
VLPEPFEDSRRLTGSNLYFPGTGAALETARGLEFDEATLAAWKRNIETACTELGWPEEKIVLRRHRTGASLAFNFAGIIGASLAPSIATWLATNHGVAYVGYYLAGAAGATLLALLAIAPSGTVGGDYDDRR